MMDDNNQLEEIINASVEDILERMKYLCAEDRFQLLLEVGEWIFDEIDVVYIVGLILSLVII